MNDNDKKDKSTEIEKEIIEMAKKDSALSEDIKK